MDTPKVISDDTRTASTTGAIRTFEEREAELHDIIAKLWSVVDPDVAPELMALVHGVLGVNDDEGHCGNRLCALLAEQDRKLAAIDGLIDRLEAAANGPDNGWAFQAIADDMRDVLDAAPVESGKAVDAVVAPIPLTTTV